jgi:AcrR family transcriptional regulator
MAYRLTEARQQKDVEQREQILQLALARVTAGGFAALTMQTLADEAGIATGSLYRYFRGKGELAAEVFARASQREVDALAEVLCAAGDPAERLAQGLRQFARRAWDSQRLAFALIAEPVDAEVDEQRLLYREAYAELFVALLEEGRRSGRFRPLPAPLIAACLVGAIAESLVGPLSPPARAARDAGHASLSLEHVSQALVQFCLCAIGAPLPEEQP